jgi:quercetin dioxygenase-like cupin family protein
MEFKAKAPTAKGPSEMFHGDVWLDSIAQGEAPSRVRVNRVRFSPGARTAWHSHAVGQFLYVIDGIGLVQSRGDDIVQIAPGDVVFTPSDEWHWHGATPDHFMTHFSITEGTGESDTPESQWGEHVSDEEYGD